jgi:glycosyltransferase involved in cell wall biosynthesis
MNKIKYSVVVCAYNEKKHLKECLLSISTQYFDKGAYEIIVIDNESIDNTPDIITEFSNEIEPTVNFTSYRIKHVGLSSSRNFAVSKCVGEIVIFIDGDAVADKNLLSAYELTFNDDHTHYSGGRIELLNKDSFVARLLQNTKYKQVFRGKKTKNYLHGANMAFRKTLLEKFRFIENFYSRGDDTSLIMRIRGNYNYAPTENAIVYHERPEKLLEWLSVTYTDMTLSYRVLNLVNRTSSVQDSSFLKGIVSNSLIVITAVLGLLNVNFLFFSMLLLLRFQRGYIFVVSPVSEYVFSLVMAIVNVVLTPPLFSYSYFKYKNERLIEPVEIVEL